MTPLFSAFIAATSAWLLAVVWSRVYDSFRGRVAQHEDYLAWLRGLKIECEHIISCIKQVRDGEAGYAAVLELNQLGCPTKKLNHDLLQAARLAVIRHPRSCVLQELLTTAYRDVDHTNGMMDRYEQNYRRYFDLIKERKAEGLNIPEPFRELSGILKPTIASLNGAQESLERLLKTVLEQQTLESQNPPNLDIMRTLRWEA